MPMIYGTNYSERSARKAQEKAKVLRDKGTVIYSIGTGIDKNAKTIEDYDKAGGNSYSTIDRFNNKNYAIGNTLNDFKLWLGGNTTNSSIGPGIGSGYNGHYFNSLMEFFHVSNLLPLRMCFQSSRCGTVA